MKSPRSRRLAARIRAWSGLLEELKHLAVTLVSFVSVVSVCWAIVHGSFRHWL